jgi:hypothetical protein
LEVTVHYHSDEKQEKYDNKKPFIDNDLKGLMSVKTTGCSIPGRSKCCIHQAANSNQEKS